MSVTAQVTTSRKLVAFRKHRVDPTLAVTKLERFNIGPQVEKVCLVFDGLHNLYTLIDY